MNAAELLNDIPLTLARAAYSNLSMDPERRADTTRNDYANTLAEDWQTLSKCADTPDKQATLEAEFARYREGYGRKYRAYLHSNSRCASWFITGPSNFPVARMEKRNNIAHKRLDELLDFRKRAVSAITKTLCPELRPIMSGDADAVERLKEKIAEAEKMQEVMKACNAAIRKHAKAGEAAQIAALAEIFNSAGIPKMEAEIKLILHPVFTGCTGFMSFELSNGSANIRRMKQRLEHISRNQAKPATTHEGTQARFEDCPAENRVRLFFPGKPSAEIRTRLKSAGFRWSPTIGAWQAYRNPHTTQTAQKEAGIDGQAERKEAIKSLFIGSYPCGIVYADRSQEVGGDYKRLAFLPYRELELQFQPDCPEVFREIIRQDASEIQAKRGQQYQVSTCGQTVLLGA
jgi:hypothetical protein